MKYIFLLLLFPLLGITQTEVPWLLQSEGKSNEFINDMSIDISDHIYITGEYFDLKMKFGEYIFPRGISDNSAYVAKLNESGGIIWAKAISGTEGWVDFTYIDSDDRGNAYLIGSFVGNSCVIGKDTIFSPNDSINNSTFYFLKFDPTGILLFSKMAKVDFRGESIAKSIVVDEKNECVYTLLGSSSTKWLQIDSFILEFNQIGYSNLLIKWNNTGVPLMGKIFKKSFALFGPHDVIIDNEGNVFISGNIAGNWMLLDSTYVYNPNIDTFDTSGYITKLDTNGKLLWANIISSITDISGISEITTDPKGNVYVNGYFRGEKLIVGKDTLFHSNIEPFYWDYYIVKYNSQGMYLWAKSFSFGQTFYPGGFMDVDSRGNLYSHWMYSLSEIKLGATIIKNNGTYDNIITKHNQEGDLIWAYGYGGNSSETPADILLDSEDNLVIGCSYRSALWEFSGHSLINDAEPIPPSRSKPKKIFIAKVIPDTTTTLNNIKTTSFNVKAHYSSSDNGVVLDIPGQPQSIDPVIKMYDLTGHELVISASTLSSEKYLIKIKEIPNGVYVVRVQFGEEYKSVLVTVVE